MQLKPMADTSSLALAQLALLHVTSCDCRSSTGHDQRTGAGDVRPGGKMRI